MAVVTPAAGEAIVLNRLFGKSTTGDLTLRLYENSVSLADGTVIGDFTEATFPGYSAITLANASVTVADNAGTETASYPQQTFTATGSGNSVYGYYVTDGSTQVVFAEVFSDGPYAISNSGDNVKVTVNYTAD